MKHTELRQFLLESNREKLSPAEKDVFLYYQSRAQNGREWNCPDAQVAVDIGRSRNSVCEARNALKRRQWITENDPFSITVLRTFSVGNSTENLSKNTPRQSSSRLNESETRLTPVENSTERVGNSTERVEISTVYIDKEKEENSLSENKKKKRGASSLSPEEFIASLKTNTAYRHIDIDREAAKAATWCEVNNRQNTRRFFVNWLNRIEAPITSKNGSSKPFFDPGRSSDEPPIAPPAPKLKPSRPAATVPIEQTHAWNAFRDAIAARINSDIFRSWFKPLIFDGIDAEKSVFLVRTGSVTHEWVTKYYGEALYEAFCTIGMPEFSIQWEIEQEVYEEIQSV